MSETMTFPERWEQFIGNYVFKDREKVYTNGSILIPLFRVEQMVEHYFVTDKNVGYTEGGRSVMKKLFISQPMNGKTDKEILEVRQRAIEAAERRLGEKVEVIDSFFQGAPADAKPLWFLGESIKLLGEADVAYFAPGWENARGCRIEYNCAADYDVPVIITVIRSRIRGNGGSKDD